MRITLDDERRPLLLRAVKAFYRDELDEDLSDFRAEKLLDFFVATLGPPVYNQAIRDAHRFMTEKLADLEGDFWEPEPE